MHTENDIDPLDTERLDLKRTDKPRGFYANKTTDNGCYIKVSLDLLKRFDDVEEIHKALEDYLKCKSA